MTLIITLDMVSKKSSDRSDSNYKVCQPANLHLVTKINFFLCLPNELSCYFLRKDIVICIVFVKFCCSFFFQTCFEWNKSQSLFAPKDTKGSLKLIVCEAFCQCLLVRSPTKQKSQTCLGLNISQCKGNKSKSRLLWKWLHISASGFGDINQKQNIHGRSFVSNVIQSTYKQGWDMYLLLYGMKKCPHCLFCFH